MYRQMSGKMTTVLSARKRVYTMEVSKGAKIRNRYDQVPHLTQDTNGKVTNSWKTDYSHLLCNYGFVQWDCPQRNFSKNDEDPLQL